MSAHSLLEYRVVSFNRKYPATAGVAKHQPLKFTNNDLARALFTTGREPAHWFAHGLASTYELLHRCLMIPAYVRRDSVGNLRFSRLARELDRSEKSAVSYAMGQALTSIFCSQVLGCTHLLHVDRYGAAHSMTFKAGRSRADLFGPSARGWVVAEAKGRSNGVETPLIGKLRSQKKTVTSIHGAVPWIATGCVACFPDSKSPRMQLWTWDPEESEPDAIQIEGSIEMYIEAYYAPILAILSAFPISRDRPGFVASRLTDLGLTVGLRSDLFEMLTAPAAPGTAAAVPPNLTQVARATLGESFAQFSTAPASEDRASARLPNESTSITPLSDRSDGVFADGTLFETEWDDATSRGDWEEEG